MRQPETLTAFVADLPQPVVRDVPGAARGREVFVAVPRAACHVPDVGEAIGVYSDLLLHDLGETTMWRGFRTAPLWGLRDSAPYLHDGGAPTVRDAIAAHWGEADKVRAAWAALPDADAAALSAFLTALTAPDPGPGPALIPSRGAR